jgi:serine/threonine-protein kinase
VLKQVGSVLDAAHRLNITHGDLRPANIQLRPNGQPFVIGFGLPVDTLQISTVNPQRAIWLTPEQIEGGKPTAASDLYQLGLIAYFLLTGSAPFQRANTREIFEAHLHELPAPAHERNAELSPLASQ